MLFSFRGLVNILVEPTELLPHFKEITIITISRTKKKKIKKSVGGKWKKEQKANKLKKPVERKGKLQYCAT